MTVGNCLVVGITGMIGGALYQALPSHAFGTTHRTPCQPNTFYLNLAEPPQSWQFPDVQFDVLYLCAGVCRMALCEEDPTSTRKVNIDGMKALVNHFPNAYIVFLSTNQVFAGDMAHTPADAPYAPQNEYGRQKAEFETYLKTHHTHYAIVRLTKVVEKNMALVTNWLQQLAHQQPINAFHDMPLAPVSLRQVIDTLLLIGEKKLTGLYQISGDQDISYYEFANHLATIMHNEANAIQAISALSAGIKKNFLPQFTSLDCSSTIGIGGEGPPNFVKVLHECFDLPK